MALSFFLLSCSWDYFKVAWNSFLLIPIIFFLAASFSASSFSTCFSTSVFSSSSLSLSDSDSDSDSSSSLAFFFLASSFSSSSIFYFKVGFMTGADGSVPVFYLSALSALDVPEVFTRDSSLLGLFSSFSVSLAALSLSSVLPSFSLSLEVSAAGSELASSSSF